MGDQQVDLTAGSPNADWIQQLLNSITQWLRQINEKYWISKFAFLLVGIVLFVADWAIDIRLLHDYHVKNHWWYFWLTLFFVLVPAVAVSLLNGKSYYERWNIKKQVDQYDKYCLKGEMIIDSNKRFIFRFVLCFLLISPVARYKKFIRQHIDKIILIFSFLFHILFLFLYSIMIRSALEYDE